MSKTAHGGAIKRLLSEGHPAMVGKADILLVEGVADRLPPGAMIVEMGPWLGALSVVLARRGTLHVVDNFVWTKDHDRRLPGLLTPGQSFRPFFESLAAAKRASVAIHETGFEDFIWTGPRIDCLVIDSPKTAAALRDCLLPVIDALTPGAPVLVKNGLNPKHHDMQAYAARLGAAGLLAHDPASGSAKSNILCLVAGQIGADARATLEACLERSEDEASMADDAWTSGPFAIGRIAQAVEAGRMGDAFDGLAQMQPDVANIGLWEDIEPSIDTRRSDATDLAMLSDLMVLHNDPVADVRLDTDITAGPLAAVRSFWRSNADKPWRGRALRPDLLRQADAFGYFAWPQQLRDLVPGRDVLDVGCGWGLHGLGFLALGANSYTGLDPATRRDRDRVKNLRTRTRAPFGWSPARIAEEIEPWALHDVSLEDWRTDARFDLAVMRGTLEQVDDIDAFFDRLVAFLRPGARLIFEHKNFYAWTGHQQQPKTVDQIDLSDPEQTSLVDWGHIGWQAPEDHFIWRSLNRLRLSDLRAATERHFEIEQLDTRLSRPETGLGRLTDEIRAMYPDLTREDFETQSLFCVARLR